MSAAAWSSRDVMRTAPRRVLLSAWQANRSRGSMWFLGVLGLLLAVLPVVLWWLTPDRSLQVGFEAAVAESVVAFILFWGVLVNNVLLQNHPHTARLLPAQVSVLRNTLLGMAALVCALTTLLSWLAGGPVLDVAVGSALGLVWLAWCGRWVWLWMLGGMLFLALPFLGVRGDLDGVGAVWHAAPEVLTLLALVLSALGLRAVVMTGDARHERAHARLQMRGAAMQGQLSGTSSQPMEGLVRWSLKRSNRAYAAWMGHLLAQAWPNVGARLALGLGPQAHWTGVLASQALGLTLVALALLAVLLFPNWDMGHDIVGWLMIGIVMIGLAVTAGQLPTALWASRREQSLLRLLPGSPQGVLLNRWLAGRLAGLHLTVLTLQVLLLAVLSNFEVGDVFGGQAVELALSGLVLSVPLGFTLWRDWSGAKAPAGSAQGLLLLAMLLVGGLAFAWVFWLDRPWYELAALTLPLMLPLGWWRWQVISRAPTACPVGRLGKASAGSALALFKSAQ